MDSNGDNTDAIFFENTTGYYIKTINKYIFIY
jgi:hypothetical protein